MGGGGGGGVGEKGKGKVELLKIGQAKEWQQKYYRSNIIDTKCV